MRCYKCGNEAKITDTFCRCCGADLSGNYVERELEAERMKTAQPTDRRKKIDVRAFTGAKERRTDDPNKVLNIASLLFLPLGIVYYLLYRKDAPYFALKIFRRTIMIAILDIVVVLALFFGLTYILHTVKGITKDLPLPPTLPTA